MRRRKSGHKRPFLALGTIAASTLALSGCGDQTPSEAMFTSVDQCVTSGMDRQVCQAGYQDAMRAHLAAAPRFNGMAVAALLKMPVDVQEEKETHTDRLLRIAASAKDAKLGGGINITKMTREERRKVLFGR